MAALSAACALPVMAQPRLPENAYRVEFVLRDTGNPAAAQGKYTLYDTPGSRVTLRLGNREPVESSKGQYTYIDAGVNIDCALYSSGDNLQLVADIDLSGFVPPDKNTSAAPNPAIKQLKLSINTLLSPGKTTTAGLIDDPVTSRKFEVQVTAIKVTP